MAAGAIPPPLFFAERRHASIGSGSGFLARAPGKHISVDYVVELSASASLTTRDRSPSKDI
jgi:hypothetical protein